MRLVADALCVEFDGDLRLLLRGRRRGGGLGRRRGRVLACVWIDLVGIEQVDLLPRQVFEQQGQGIESWAELGEDGRVVTVVVCGA